MTIEIDKIDRKILTILQDNARTSRAEIARQVGLTPTAVYERIRKLEAEVITRYEVRLDPRALGISVLAYIFVSEIKPVKGGRTGAALARIPEVEEVAKIAGEDCYLVKVRAPDTEGLARILDRDIATIPSVGGTRTTIVLESLLEECGPQMAKLRPEAGNSPDPRHPARVESGCSHAPQDSGS